MRRSTLVLLILALAACFHEEDCNGKNPVGPTTEVTPDPTDPTGPTDPGTNQAPDTVGTIPTQILTAGGNTRRVEVAPYFRDPDDDPLTYAAVSASPGTAAANTLGSVVTLMPVAAGTTTITVTASDGSLSAMQMIAVTVEPEEPEDDPQPTVVDCVELHDDGFDREDPGGGYERLYYWVTFRNTCSYDIRVRYALSVFHCARLRSSSPARALVNRSRFS